MSRFVMGDDGLGAGHDAPEHGDLALVQGASAPIGDHVAIDIGEAPRGVRNQSAHQRLGGIDAFELSQELSQGRTLVALANQCGQGMLARIEGGEGVDAQQGGQHKGLKAALQGRLAVMQQGKVIVRMRLAIGLGSRLKLGDDWAKGPELLEPVRKDVDAHQRQLGRHVDDSIRGSAQQRSRAARASPGSTELTFDSPAVDLAQADRDWQVRLGDYVEEHSSWSLRVVVENGPDQGLVDLAKLSAGIKGWTCGLIKITVAWGDVHDFILFDMRSGCSLHIHSDRSMSHFQCT